MNEKRAAGMASLCWLPARYLNFPYWTFFPDWNTSARNDCYTVRNSAAGSSSAKSPIISPGEAAEPRRSASL